MPRPFLFLYRRILAQLLLLCSFGLTTYAQVPDSSVSSSPTLNGFSLQKSTSLTVAPTGAGFMYVLTFTIPAGATGITITDQVPASLVIDNVIVPAGGYGGNVPTVTTVGNLVTINFASAPNPILGSININVHFPVERSCPNLMAANEALLRATSPATVIKSGYVYTRAQVTRPWKIRKAPTFPLMVNNTCPYGTLSDTVWYTVDIVKSSWAIVGSASLYNVSIQDILPPGATVVPGTSTGTSGGNYNTSANLIGSSISSTGSVTMGGGIVLDATVNNVYRMTFKVVHAPMPLNTCIINRVLLTGNYRCNTTDSPQYIDSAKVGIQKVLQDSGVATLTKGVSLSGNLPGCTGFYRVRMRNTGSGTLPAYVLLDTFPSCLILTDTSFPAGCTMTQISTSPVVWQLVGPALPPGANSFHDYIFNFTIGNGCGTSVTNTVSQVSPPGPRAVRTFPLLPDSVKPCITKQICSGNPTTVGGLVRFRLRVQNMGGTPLTTINIADVLDNANLEYVSGLANELYYIAPNPLAITNCSSGSIIPAGTTPWNTGGSPVHVTPVHTMPNALRWNIDTIPVECGSVSNVVCGQAWGLKAYYIEFTVRVKDTAGIGNVRNIASLQGGNVTTPVSDVATFIINGNLNFGVSKSVSADGGATFGPTANTAAGSNIQYKLSTTNTGVGLALPTIIDLLPRDNAGGATADNFILANTNRLSAFDVRYGNLVSSSHTIAPSGQSYSLVNGITSLPELGFTVNTALPLWSTTLTPNAVNIRTLLSQTIGTAPLSYIFTAGVSNTAAEGETACNTFALRGSIKQLINYNSVLVQQPPIESDDVCIRAIKSDCCNPINFDVPREVCAGVAQEFCVIDTCLNNNYTWNFGDGTPIQTGTCITHTYTTPGVYTVSISWETACGSNEKKYEITVKECPCEVNAFANITSNGLSITADASGSTSTYPMVMYVWDFGDGTYGTGITATHNYAVAGTYDVTLTVYTLDSKGQICDCIGRCRTRVEVNPRFSARYRCGELLEAKRSQAKAANDGISVSSSLQLKASPNPFTENLIVSLGINGKLTSENPADYSVELASTNGTVLQSQRLQHFNRKLNFQTGQYAPGSYVVMLKNKAGQIQSLQVVKLNR